MNTICPGCGTEIGQPHHVDCDCKNHDPMKSAGTGDWPEHTPHAHAMTASDVFNCYAVQKQWGLSEKLNVLSAWFSEGLVDLALERLDEGGDPSNFWEFLDDNFGALGESGSDAPSNEGGGV